MKELHERRRKLLADCRALNDKVGAEDRAFTDEENREYDKMWKEAEELQDRIDRETKLREEERKALESRGTTPPAAADPPAPSGEKRTIKVRNGRGWEEREVSGVTASTEYQQYYESYLRGSRAVEQRLLQADSDEAGGFMVAPQQMAAGLIKAVDDEVFVRGLATVYTVDTADSLGAPSLDADPADADWTSEVAIGSEDSTMDFGKRELHPHPLGKLIKVTRKLLRLTSGGAESIVRDRLGYKFGITHEKAYMTGTGSGQPLGVFTASNDGIPTSRDVSTDNSTTAFTADGLINAKFSIKGQYWPRLRWIMHRDAVKMAAKLKDGDGRYLWSESVRVGEPDTIKGVPVLMSEYAPNTFTTGLYVGILGDFSNYWIADALTLTIQRLDELYAGSNKVGFIGRLESDGMPVLAEAFARVTLA